MKKNTTFPNLIQKFVSAEELDLLVKVVGYEDVARKMDVMTLIQYLITAAACEWKSFRYCADVGPSVGLREVNYSTLSKKAGHVDFELMKQLFDLVVSKCNRTTRRALKLPNNLLIVDSTTITVGKSRLPWALYHGERSGIKLHVSYFPDTEMPFRVAESTGLKHDGPIGEQLADSRFVLVEDRAYFKIKRIDQFISDQQDFVIRIKENVEIHRPKSLKRLLVEDSRITRDITCQLGTPQSRSSKRHRIVFFLDDRGKEIRVITSLMMVSAEVIADIYKERWKIESFFRWIKQNLNVPILFGTTPNAVYNQLFAALIAYVLLKWLYKNMKNKKVFHALNFAQFHRRLLHNELPIDWLSELVTFLKEYFIIYGISPPDSV